MAELAHKRVCFSGFTPEQVTAYTDVVVRAGGIVQANITGDTSLLVTCKGFSLKRIVAAQMGIPILSAERFAQLVDRAASGVPGDGQCALVTDGLDSLPLLAGYKFSTTCFSRTEGDTVASVITEKYGGMFSPYLDTETSMLLIPRGHFSIKSFAADALSSSGTARFAGRRRRSGKWPHDEETNGPEPAAGGRSSNAALVVSDKMKFAWQFNIPVVEYHKLLEALKTVTRQLEGEGTRHRGSRARGAAAPARGEVGKSLCFETVAFIFSIPQSVCAGVTSTTQDSMATDGRNSSCVPYALPALPDATRQADGSGSDTSYGGDRRSDNPDGETATRRTGLDTFRSTTRCEGGVETADGEIFGAEVGDDDDGVPPAGACWGGSLANAGVEAASALSRHPCEAAEVVVGGPELRSVVAANENGKEVPGLLPSRRVSSATVSPQSGRSPSRKLRRVELGGGAPGGARSVEEGLPRLLRALQIPLLQRPPYTTVVLLGCTPEERSRGRRQALFCGFSCPPIVTSSTDFIICGSLLQLASPREAPDSTREVENGTRPSGSLLAHNVLGNLAARTRDRPERNAAAHRPKWQSMAGDAQGGPPPPEGPSAGTGFWPSHDASGAFEGSKEYSQMQQTHAVLRNWLVSTAAFPLEHVVTLAWLETCVSRYAAYMQTMACSEGMDGKLTAPPHLFPAFLLPRPGGGEGPGSPGCYFTAAATPAPPLEGPASKAALPATMTAPRVGDGNFVFSFLPPPASTTMVGVSSSHEAAPWQPGTVSSLGPAAQLHTESAPQKLSERAAPLASREQRRQEYHDFKSAFVDLSHHSLTRTKDLSGGVASTRPPEASTASDSGAARSQSRSEQGGMHTEPVDDHDLIRKQALAILNPMLDRIPPSSSGLLSDCFFCFEEGMFSKVHLAAARGLINFGHGHSEKHTLEAWKTLERASRAGHAATTPGNDRDIVSPIPAGLFRRSRNVGSAGAGTGDSADVGNSVAGSSPPRRHRFYFFVCAHSFQMTPAYVRRVQKVQVELQWAIAGQRSVPEHVGQTEGPAAAVPTAGGRRSSGVPGCNESSQYRHPLRGVQVVTTQFIFHCLREGAILDPKCLFLLSHPISPNCMPSTKPLLFRGTGGCGASAKTAAPLPMGTAAPEISHGSSWGGSSPWQHDVAPVGSQLADPASTVRFPELSDSPRVSELLSGPVFPYMTFLASLHAALGQKNSISTHHDAPVRNRSIAILPPSPWLSVLRYSKIPCIGLCVALLVYSRSQRRQHELRDELEKVVELLGGSIVTVDPAIVDDTLVGGALQHVRSRVSDSAEVHPSTADVQSARLMAIFERTTHLVVVLDELRCASPRPASTLPAPAERVAGSCGKSAEGSSRGGSTFSGPPSVPCTSPFRNSQSNKPSCGSGNPLAERLCSTTLECAWAYCGGRPMVSSAAQALAHASAFTESAPLDASTGGSGGTDDPGVEALLHRCAAPGADDVLLVEGTPDGQPCGTMQLLPGRAPLAPGHPPRQAPGAPVTCHGVLNIVSVEWLAASACTGYFVDEGSFTLSYKNLATMAREMFEVSRGVPAESDRTVEGNTVSYRESGNCRAVETTGVPPTISPPMHRSLGPVASETCSAQPVTRRDSEPVAHLSTPEGTPRKKSQGTLRTPCRSRPSTAPHTSTEGDGRRSCSPLTGEVGSSSSARGSGILPPNIGTHRADSGHLGAAKQAHCHSPEDTECGLCVPASSLGSAALQPRSTADDRGGASDGESPTSEKEPNTLGSAPFRLFEQLERVRQREIERSSRVGAPRDAEIEGNHHPVASPADGGALNLLKVGGAECSTLLPGQGPAWGTDGVAPVDAGSSEVGLAWSPRNEECGATEEVQLVSVASKAAGRISLNSAKRMIRAGSPASGADAEAIKRKSSVNEDDHSRRPSPSTSKVLAVHIVGNIPDREALLRIVELFSEGPDPRAARQASGQRGQKTNPLHSRMEACLDDGHGFLSQSDLHRSGLRPGEEPHSPSRCRLRLVPSSGLADVLVTHEINQRESVLVALAAGIYLVTPQFLYDCGKYRCVPGDITPYEWCPAHIAGRVQQLPLATRRLVSQCRLFRQRRERTGGRAFDGVAVALLAREDGSTGDDGAPREKGRSMAASMAAIIEAGGGVFCGTCSVSATRGLENPGGPPALLHPMGVLQRCEVLVDALLRRKADVVTGKGKVGSDCNDPDGLFLRRCGESVDRMMILVPSALFKAPLESAAGSPSPAGAVEAVTFGSQLVDELERWQSRVSDLQRQVMAGIVRHAGSSSRSLPLPIHTITLHREEWVSLVLQERHLAPYSTIALGSWCETAGRK